jgi:hypothetical protein
MQRSLAVHDSKCQRDAAREYQGVQQQHQRVVTDRHSAIILPEWSLIYRRVETQDFGVVSRARDRLHFT